MTSLDEPTAGELVAGRYQIEEQLGRGSYGTVMAAFDRTLARPVALKILARDRLATASDRARFLREAQTAAQLAGPHGVQIYDAGELADGRPFISMERLTGRDLAHDLAERGRFSVAEAVACVIAVCRGLAPAHARGIVHRDLKPSNLFRARDPDGTTRVRVLDFGVARVPSAAAITASDAWVGTPSYMAPEQLTAPATVDHRADIWALGAVLHELVTGRRIFEAATPAALAAKILTERPPSLRRHDAELPRALDDIVARCLALEPADRFATVDQLALALAPLAPSTAATLEAPAVVRAIVDDERGIGDAEARPRRWLRVAALAGALLVIAVVAFSLGRQRGRSTSTTTAAAGTAVAPATIDAAAPPVDASVPDASPPIVAPPPVADAGVDARPPLAAERDRPPSSAEIADLVQACLLDARTAPMALVPANDGPATTQCRRLAALGCVEIRRRCRRDAAPDLRDACARYLAAIADACRATVTR